MAKDAITLFKEAAAQMQREETYLALMGAMQKNDEDETLQQLIGDFHLELKNFYSGFFAGGGGVRRGLRRRVRLRCVIV